MPYTTLAAVHLELGIATAVTTDDALLSVYIPQAQQAIDTYTSRTFEAASDTTRYLDAIANVRGSELDLGGDLCAITSVTNGDSVLVSATEYVTTPRNKTPYYVLTLLSSKGKVWTYSTDPENAIKIIGKWAYSATCPADIARACTRLVAYWYRLKDSQVFDVSANVETGQMTLPKGIPTDVKTILDSYRPRYIV